VPLPAALPLFGTALAGLGGAGWLGRRKVSADTVTSRNSRSHSRANRPPFVLAFRTKREMRHRCVR
jgi:hypothetical protein